ncbi:MAG: EAL domain-containing protein [Salinarimonadaceae bacterium]|nr:MAG: EAL domain-containing protein [Salinarimonadaceae bacterium]
MDDGSFVGGARPRRVTVARGFRGRIRTCRELVFRGRNADSPGIRVRRDRVPAWSCRTRYSLRLHRINLILMRNAHSSPKSGIRRETMDAARKQAMATTRDETRDETTAPHSLRNDAADESERRRIAALGALAILDTPPSPGFDRICAMARDLFDAQWAAIAFVDERRLWFKARIGVPFPEMAREGTFCETLMGADGVVVVPDAAADPRFANLVTVHGEHGIRACAGAPLVLDSGDCVGALCVMDTRPRNFDDCDRALLAELAKVAVSEIALHQANHAVQDTQSALVSAEQRYRALAEANAALVWRADAHGRLVDISLMGPFSGMSREDFLGLGWLALLHPDERTLLTRQALRAGVRGATYEGAHRLVCADGGYRWTRIRVVPLRDASGEVCEWVGTGVDEHDRHVAEANLRRSEARLRLALNAARMVAWEYDPEALTTQRSDNSRDIIGVEADDLNGYLLNIHPEDRRLFHEAYRRGGPMRVAELRYMHPNGQMMWLSSRGQEFVEEDGERRIIGVTYDITDRKISEERAWRAANHDGLTGLPNRAFFQSNVETLLRIRDGGCKALILVDIDEFKAVNEAIGHDAGDALLRETAERLRAALCDNAVIARLGSDEFGIFLTDCADAEEATRTAERLIAEIGREIYRADHIIACRASGGIALHPQHGETAAELMKDAETALYAAKSQDRNRALLYDPGMRELIAVRAQITAEMRAALENGQIIPFYQPRVDLRTGAIIGFEALARWRHPTRGILTPGVFATAFDTPELALGIGRKMARDVLADIRAWLDEGLDPGSVAVNLSPADFGEGGLSGRLLGLLREAGVPPKNFTVEVTESVFLGKGGGAVASALQALNAGGVRIALDDFGTGFASLTHLKQYPVDEIKIDRSFVMDAPTDPDDAAIVTAVIGLGRALDLGVVAEGVETSEQAQFLRDHGCVEAQGFLFGKPMVGSRATTLLRAQAQARAEREAPLALRA